MSDGQLIRRALHCQTDFWHLQRLDNVQMPPKQRFWICNKNPGIGP
jgi:hypothetical protein